MDRHFSDRYARFAAILFRATLDGFFRCADCNTPLTDVVGFAMVTNGQIKDLHCPRCGQRWTFRRIKEPQDAP